MASGRMPASRNACTEVAPWRLESRLLSARQDHRDVGEDRQRVAEGLVAEHLLRRVRQVVVAADDVGDLHGHVVHDHAEVVGRRAVGPHEDPVVELRRCSNATVPWITSSTTVSPSRGIASRRACGSDGRHVGRRGRCPGSGTVSLRASAAFRGARRASPACSGSGRRGPRRAAARRARGRSRSARSGGSRAWAGPRPSRARASAGRRGSTAMYSSVERERSVSSMRRMKTPW